MRQRNDAVPCMRLWPWPAAVAVVVVRSNPGRALFDGPSDTLAEWSKPDGAGQEIPVGSSGLV